MPRLRPIKLPTLKSPLPTQSLPSTVPPELTDSTEVTVGGQKFRINALDLKKLCLIGRGQYGRVEKMYHAPSENYFAVKFIDSFQEHIKRTQIMKDLEVGKNTPCPCVILCYGGLVVDYDVLVIMELMDISLDKLRRKVYKAGQHIPESILAYMIQRVITGLEYLHANLRVMHRDVKPLNMLADRGGLVKVCDFGISGDLIQSIAPSNVGTNRYLAPERIKPEHNQSFGIRSDVWSLGLSLIELATGHLCYESLEHNIFGLLDAVVVKDSPKLPENDRFSVELQEFTSQCLFKRDSERPDYIQLLKKPFLASVELQSSRQQMREFLPPYLDPVQN